MTRSKLRENTCLICEFNPRIIKDALENEDWINVMNEEIDQIEKNNTWTLVLRPIDKNMIGTNWILKNKLNENGEFMKNKARLFCKGYAQNEGIDYGENFSTITRF